jgi:FlaA1/EpsC-like NDP-sugar epimerase
VYRGVWRHFGLMDAVVVGKGVLAGAVTAQLVILYLYRFFSYSRTVFAIYAVLLLALVVASRASFRLIGEFVHRRRVATDRLLIYRSGDEGGLALRELLNDSNTAYRMLGFVDDDPQSRQTRVHGYPVLGGYDYLVSQITGHRVDIVIVSGPRIDPGRVRDLAAICASHHVALSRLHVDLEPLVVAVDAAGVVPKLRPLAARPGRRPDA